MDRQIVSAPRDLGTFSFSAEISAEFSYVALCIILVDYDQMRLLTRQPDDLLDGHIVWKTSKVKGLLPIYSPAPFRSMNMVNKI